MASGQVKGGGRVSPARKQLESIRDVAPARLHAALRLTGNVNSATAFALWSNNPAGVDIFDAASKITNQGNNPYNNWLASGAKPQFDVFPEAIGLYIGEGFPTNYPIKSVLAEHSMLTIVMPSGANLVKQQALTIPSGHMVEERYATADTTGSDKKLYETFGHTTAVGLFKVPEKIVFKEDQQLKAMLTIDALALAEINAISTALPSRGMLIEVVVYGKGALKVGTSR